MTCNDWEADSDIIKTRDNVRFQPGLLLPNDNRLEGYEYVRRQVFARYVLTGHIVRICTVPRGSEYQMALDRPKGYRILDGR